MGAGESWMADREISGRWRPLRHRVSPQAAVLPGDVIAETAPEGTGSGRRNAVGGREAGDYGLGMGWRRCRRADAPVDRGGSPVRAGTSERRGGTNAHDPCGSLAAGGAAAITGRRAAARGPAQGAVLGGGGSPGNRDGKPRRPQAARAGRGAVGDGCRGAGAGWLIRGDLRAVAAPTFGCRSCGVRSSGSAVRGPPRSCRFCPAYHARCWQKTAYTADGRSRRAGTWPTEPDEPHVAFAGRWRGSRGGYLTMRANWLRRLRRAASGWPSHGSRRDQLAPSGSATSSPGWSRRRRGSRGRPVSGRRGRDPARGLETVIRTPPAAAPAIAACSRRVDGGRQPEAPGPCWPDMPRAGRRRPAPCPGSTSPDRAAKRPARPQRDRGLGRNGQHLLTYGRPSTPFAMVAGAIGKDEPDGLPSLPSPPSAPACWMQRSRKSFKAASSSLAVDWSDWRRYSGPAARHQDCDDPEASGGTARTTSFTDNDGC